MRHPRFKQGTDQRDRFADVDDYEEYGDGDDAGDGYEVGTEDEDSFADDFEEGDYEESDFEEGNYEDDFEADDQEWEEDCPPQESRLEQMRTTLVEGWHSLRLHADRTIGHLTSLRGGGGRRVVLACPGPFPSPEHGHIAWEAKHLLDGGFDARLLAWSKGPPREMDAIERALLRRCRTLTDDPRGHGLSRGYWAKRLPKVLEELETSLESQPDLCRRALIFARAAAALRPSYLHGFGLRDGASLVQWTARLLRIPYGLAVAGPDADGRRVDSELAGALLRGAGVVVADCEQTAQVVLRLAQGKIEHLAIKPPAVYHEPPPAGVPASSQIRALVARPVHPAVLMQIADATKQVVDGGGDLHLSLLGREIASRSRPTDTATLYERLEHHGLESHCWQPGEDEFPALRDRLAESSLLLALHRHGAAPANSGIPVVVLAAMAAGVPVVAHRGGPLDGVIRDWEEGVLVPPDNTRALARALARLCGDLTLRMALGEQARARFAADFAPDQSGAALRIRLKQVLRENAKR